MAEVTASKAWFYTTLQKKAGWTKWTQSREETKRQLQLKKPFPHCKNDYVVNFLHLAPVPKEETILAKVITESGTCRNNKRLKRPVLEYPYLQHTQL